MLFFLAATAEKVEKAPSRRADLTAAAAASESIAKFGLPPLAAAAAHERLALLLKLGELAPRVFDPGIHIETFRAPHQAAAENEEAVETASVLHGRLRSLEHAVGLGNLLLDAAEVRAVRAATALGGDKLLLELHAADLLLAHRTLREARARVRGKAGATEREHAKARPADGRPHE